MQTLRFESYRDLVRLVSRGVTEAQGLTLVEQESLNRRAAEHAAVQAANDAVYNNPRPGGAAAGGPGTLGSGVPAGTGMYSAMGFSYDTAAAGPAGAGAAAADSSDSDSDDLDSDGEAGANEMLSEADMAQEAEDDRVDEIAEGFALQVSLAQCTGGDSRQGGRGKAKCGASTASHLHVTRHQCRGLPPCCAVWLCSVQDPLAVGLC